MTGIIKRRDILIGVAALPGVLIGSRSTIFAATPKIHDISISSFRFEPEHLTVRTGDSIRWTNEDIAPHTATATDKSWDTGKISRGESKVIVVSNDMMLNYYCAYHPHMKGRIVRA